MKKTAISHDEFVYDLYPPAGNGATFVFCGPLGVWLQGSDTCDDREVCKWRRGMGCSRKLARLWLKAAGYEIIE